MRAAGALNRADARSRRTRVRSSNLTSSAARRPSAAQTTNVRPAARGGHSQRSDYTVIAATLIPSASAIRRAVTSLARNDRRQVLLRFPQHRRRRCFRRAAVEWRLRRIVHLQLDFLRRLLAAQFGSQTQRAVDARGDACRENPVAVDHHAFVHRDRAEIAAADGTTPNASWRAGPSADPPRRRAARRCRPRRSAHACA